MTALNRFLVNQKHLLFLFLGMAIFASLQSYLSPLKSFVEGGRLYTSYNNYIIFKQSFFHLIEGKDLYIEYVEEQGDLYKYSPTFALLFGVLAILPDVLGLSLWNILNVVVLLYSVYYLPKFDLRTKGLILVFVAVEMLTSVQNEQSNALIAGLLLFTFGALERRKYWLASFCLVSTVYIKLFGIVGLALYLLYPNKLKLTYTTACWIVLFTIFPLVVVDTEQFIYLYKSWGNLLSNDHSISDGISVIGWLRTWFGLEFNKTYVSVAGAILFCIPLLRINAYSNYTFRILMLASVLIWVVIFNHRAESPTFIIAVAGVALWYYSQLPSKANYILLILALVFTILSPTDLFPKFVRNEWMKPYVVKAVPCILIWAKLLYDLTVGKLLPRNFEEAESAK
ncbi:glycosyltransferase family 87 protein [Dyadobacter crusticola]|uniref:glycosyltransferase family 87 protein n=1 Tax=Dyadobacter crusticola TaxID=292407 RepID=UPI0004E28D4E|nr:glycosyltransferase family 87 protein [Dyadobacter crusticola]